MSLALGYASSDDEDLEKLSKDAFGLSSIHTSKRPKVADIQSLSTNAAPDVLSEVIEVL
jgi:pre-mRNA-processing factor 17